MRRNYYQVNHSMNMSSGEELMAGTPAETPLDFATEPTPPNEPPRLERRVMVVGLSVALLLLVAGLVFFVRHKSGAERGDSAITAHLPAAANILRLKGTTA